MSNPPARLLCNRATRPMMKKLTQGRISTIPSQEKIRPVPLSSVCRVAGSICHQLMPAAITPSATRPVITLPVMVLRNSIATFDCNLAVVESCYKAGRIRNRWRESPATFDAKAHNPHDLIDHVPSHQVQALRFRPRQEHCR